jgi:hypothetical protein
MAADRYVCQPLDVATRDREFTFWLSVDEIEQWNESDVEMRAVSGSEIRGRAKSLARVLRVKTITLKDPTGGVIEVVTVTGAPEDNGHN